MIKVVLKNDKDIVKYINKDILLGGKAFKFDISLKGFIVKNLEDKELVKNNINKKFWIIEDYTSKVKKAIEEDFLDKKKEEENNKKPTKVFSVQTGEYVDMPPKEPEDPIVEALEKIKEEDAEKTEDTNETSKDYNEKGEKEMINFGEEVKEIDFGKDLMDANKKLALELSSVEETEDKVVIPPKDDNETEETKKTDETEEVVEKEAKEEEEVKKNKEPNNSKKPKKRKKRR